MPGRKLAPRRGQSLPTAYHTSEHCVERLNCFGMPSLSMKTFPRSWISCALRARILQQHASSQRKKGAYPG